MISLRKVSETADTLTLELVGDPPAGTVGFRSSPRVVGGVRQTGAKQWAHSWNPSKRTFTFAPGFEPYVVEALDAADAAAWPAVEPPPSGWLRPLARPRPTLTAPTVIHVHNGNRAFGEIARPMPLDRDYRLVFDEVITAGTFQWFGGRRVECVAAQVDLRAKLKPCGQFVNSDVIGMQIGSVKEIFHLEGALVQAPAQGIVFWATAGVYTTTMRIHRSRIEALEKVATNGSHTDGIQLYAGPARLEMFDTTIVSRGPTLQWQTYDLAADDMPTPAGYVLDNVNLIQLPQSENCVERDGRPHHAWVVSKNLKNASAIQRPWPQHNANVWLSQGPNAGFNAGGTSGDAKEAGWNPPGASGYVVTGEAIKDGVPPTGDFAKAALVGLGYQG